MSEELKPCAHCGGLGIPMERTCNPKDACDPAARAFPIVRCGTCHAEACGGDWQSIETAIEAWNRRTSPVPGVGGDRAAQNYLEQHEADQQTIRALRAQIEAFGMKSSGELWYWQGDGADNLESLTCPILIHAAQLRALSAPPAVGALTPQEFMKCIYEAGEPTRLIFEQGPYSIDTLTAGGDKLLEAINRRLLSIPSNGTECEKCGMLGAELRDLYKVSEGSIRFGRPPSPYYGGVKDWMHDADIDDDIRVVLNPENHTGGLFENSAIRIAKAVALNRPQADSAPEPAGPQECAHGIPSGTICHKCWTEKVDPSHADSGRPE